MELGTVLPVASSHVPGGFFTIEKSCRVLYLFATLIFASLIP